jgi:hypothetical protein
VLCQKSTPRRGKRVSEAEPCATRYELLSRTAATGTSPFRPRPRGSTAPPRRVQPGLLSGSSAGVTVPAISSDPAEHLSQSAFGRVVSIAIGKLRPVVLTFNG